MTFLRADTNPWATAGKRLTMNGVSGVLKATSKNGRPGFELVPDVLDMSAGKPVVPVSPPISPISKPIPALPTVTVGGRTFDMMGNMVSSPAAAPSPVIPPAAPPNTNRPAVVTTVTTNQYAPSIGSIPISPVVNASSVPALDLVRKDNCISIPTPLVSTKPTVSSLQGITTPPASKRAVGRSMGFSASKPGLTSFAGGTSNLICASAKLLKRLGIIS